MSVPGNEHGPHSPQADVVQACAGVTDRPESVLDELWNLDFDSAKSMRYHAHRRNFWLSLDHTAKVLAAISATAVVITLFGERTVVAQILALCVALFSTADIVIGFGRRALEHNDLYRRFSKLQEDIILANADENVGYREIAKFKARRLEIERDEPGTIDLLERRSSAEECLARGLELRDAWKLSSVQWLLAQWSLPFIATDRRRA